MKHGYVLFLLPLLLGCGSETKMKAGCIKLEVFVYNDPGGNLYDSYRLPVSTLYFLDDEFIEQVPVVSDTTGIPPFAYIREGKFVPLNGLAEKKELLTFYPLSEKRFGAVFADTPVPFYEKREELSDTSFNGYNYRRVRIISPEDYSVFYIHQTDTFLPFSLSLQFDRDYHGVLNRIDTYEIRNDRFISLRMQVSRGIPEPVYSTLNLHD
ncbi:MAG: hypothetical protein AB2L20_07600 [Mangrovibacterium sp.]